MMAFDLEYRGKTKAELYDDFISFLINEYAQGRRVILIIDEAQNMQASGLENVRMLSNVNASKEYLLHLILVGQPELRDLLQRDDLRQLTQRVSAAYHLNPLSVKEVREYIDYRLQVAGATERIFSPKAKLMIARKAAACRESSIRFVTWPWFTAFPPAGRLSMSVSSRTFSKTAGKWG